MSIPTLSTYMWIYSIEHWTVLNIRIIEIFLQAKVHRKVLRKEFFIDSLAAQLDKGNYTDRPGTSQKRSNAGTFGTKDIYECPWRTWLGKLYSSHKDTVLTCSCVPDKYAFITAPAVIKHLERNPCQDGVIVLGEAEISIMKIVSTGNYAVGYFNKII